ncbi:MAG: phage tail tape measure protein, partial [Planctomycetota bacterium]
MPRRNKVEVIIEGKDKATGPIKVVGKALAGLGGIAATAAGTFAGNLLSGAVGQLQELGRAAVGVGAQALQMGADFEYAMASMGAAAKSDISEGVTSLEELHDAAIAVGGDTRLLGVSATGAADSIIGLYKAGLDASQIFGDLNAFMNEGAELGGVLRASIDLAAATQLDMVQASDLAATTLATFGLSAEEIGPAMDNFVKAADASVAEVEDLAAAIANVGPTMAAFGIPLEDVNNALAVLSTRGIAGSEAGTALKSMFTNMMRPTNQVKGALAALGVNIYDTEGAMLSMPEIIGQFERALYGVNEVMVEVGGRTKDQQDELDRLTKMYGKAQQSLADYEAGIKGAGMSEKARAKKIAALRDQMVALEGEMAPLNAIQGEMVKTTRTLTEAQRNQYIQTIFGTFGMKAANTLLTEGVEGWTDMADETARATGTQAQAAAKAATLSGMMEALEGTIETVKIQIGEALLPVGKELIAWFSEMVDQHGPALVEWIGTAIPMAIQTLATFWTSTLLPALQVAGAYIVDTVIPTIAQITGWLRDNLPGALQIASAYWTGVLLPAVQVVAVFFKETLLPAIQTAITFVQSTVLPIFQAIYDWFIMNWPLISAVFQTAWTVISAVIQSVVEVIVGQVWPQLQEAFVAIQEAMASLGISWTEVWSAIQIAVGIVAAAIGAILLALIAAIAGVANGISAAIMPIVQGFMLMKEGAITAFTGLVQFFTGIWTLIQGLFTANGQMMEAGWQALWQGIVNIFMGVTGVLAGLIQTTMGSILAFLGGFVEGVIGFFTNLYTALVGGSIIPDLVTAMLALFTDMVT